jgi:beta-glucosidase
MNQPNLRTKRVKFIPSSLLAIAAGLACNAMAMGDGPTVDQRVDKIFSQLTQDEKIGLLHGYDAFYTEAVDHAGVPRTKFTDGPVGTRNDGASTAYPAGALLAATWDPAIAQREGEALGRDARSRGDHILLGPGVNIYRQPQNGRNFEYLGEDPFLAGQIDVGYIQGVQSKGVAACVKHYACNNQEIRRDDVDVHVDERTLHEIYLPAFEAAITQGHARAIMASYNKINGHWATANHYLLTDVLRKEWGFDGIAMSDWGAVHETLGPMTAGLDLEMPDPHYFNPKTLQPLLDSGKITQADIDEKVKHILHVEVEMGWLDREQKDPSIAKNDDANNETALAVAREGIVLLKNTGNLLPLDRSKIKNIVVLGTDEDKYIAGGGSSYTQPARPITLFQGLQSSAGNVNVISIPTPEMDDGDMRALAKASIFAPGKDPEKPLLTQFFNNAELKGEPALERGDKAIDFNWRRKLPVPAITSDHFSARFTGAITPTVSADYTFIVRSDDGSRVILDGKTIVDNWHDQQAHTESATIKLEANHIYQLVVEYYNVGGEASVQFAYGPSKTSFTPEQEKQIADADAAIISVREHESEGSDRAYELPGSQLDLIQSITKMNPHTVVILEAGGNVGMKQWIDLVPALVDAWYPGQAGGKAIAEILFGDTNPSGHLPDSFEKDWTDSPAFGNYPGKADVNYTEGLYVGYRWYDKKKIEPRFPFGFGLSYTTFEIKKTAIAPGTGDDNFTVTADVTNTGSKAGATVAQLYVRSLADEKIDRPVQELKGFARVDLKPGETKTVTIPLNKRSFSYWDATSHSWQIIPGRYEIAVGQSSRDIAATVSAEVK